MATTTSDSLESLEPFVGDWTMAVAFEDMPPVTDSGARVSFEWLPGERFLIERWEVPVPEAPDGIAIIGADPESEGNYLQHYFDSRGVARIYKMSFEDGVWKLWRDEPDFSPLDFSQRYTGTFSDDGKTIAGAWEIFMTARPGSTTSTSPTSRNEEGPRSPCNRPSPRQCLETSAFSLSHCSCIARSPWQAARHGRGRAASADPAVLGEHRR